jgi:beta-lactam-binding protein with PASTA domain
VDLVVAQAPSGGAQVDKGSSVTLNVSKGKAPPPEPVTVSVPDVVGQSEGSAAETIKAAGLHPSIQHVPSTQEKGTVVSQSPGGGASANKGAGVLLNVSTGPAKPEKTKPAKPGKSQAPETATVPDVTGESKDSATSDLRAAGFSVSSVDQPTADPTMDGVVIDQSPSGGSAADPDSSVTIYVGRFGTG